jgi:hypothetical protein
MNELNVRFLLYKKINNSSRLNLLRVQNENHSFSVNPTACKFGMQANFTMGGGPHIRICVVPSSDGEGK